MQTYRQTLSPRSSTSSNPSAPPLTPILELEKPVVDPIQEMAIVSDESEDDGEGDETPPGFLLRGPDTDKHAKEDMVEAFSNFSFGSTSSSVPVSESLTPAAGPIDQSSSLSDHAASTSAPDSGLASTSTSTSASSSFPSSTSTSTSSRPTTKSHPPSPNSPADPSFNNFSFGTCASVPEPSPELPGTPIAEKGPFEYSAPAGSGPSSASGSASSSRRNSTWDLPSNRRQGSTTALELGQTYRRGSIVAQSQIQNLAPSHYPYIDRRDSSLYPYPDRRESELTDPNSNYESISPPATRRSSTCSTITTLPAIGRRPSILHSASTNTSAPPPLLPPPLSNVPDGTGSGIGSATPSRRGSTFTTQFQMKQLPSPIPPSLLNRRRGSVPAAQMFGLPMVQGQGQGQGVDPMRMRASLSGGVSGWSGRGNERGGEIGEGRSLEFQGFASGFGITTAQLYARRGSLASSDTGSGSGGSISSSTTIGPGSTYTGSNSTTIGSGSNDPTTAATGTYRRSSLRNPIPIPNPDSTSQNPTSTSQSSQANRRSSLPYSHFPSSQTQTQSLRPSYPSSSPISTSPSLAFNQNQNLQTQTSPNPRRTSYRTLTSTSLSSSSEEDEEEPPLPTPSPSFALGGGNGGGGGVGFSDPWAELGLGKGNGNGNVNLHTRGYGVGVGPGELGVGVGGGGGRRRPGLETIDSDETEVGR